MSDLTVGHSSPISEAEVGDIVEIHGFPMDVISKLEGQGVTVVDQRDRTRHNMPWNSRCNLTRERWLD